MRSKRKMLFSMSMLARHVGGEQVESRQQINYTRKKKSNSNNSNNNSAVEEEYQRAIRTKSFTNLCVRVQDQRSSTSSSTNSSNKALTSTQEDQPDYTLLLEPKQETLASIITKHHHHLPYVLHFFDTTLHACVFCGSLVDSIRRARANQLELNQVHHSALPGDGDDDDEDGRYRSVVAKLQRFRRLGNPFAGPQLLDRMHEAYVDTHLVRQLMSAHRHRAAAARRWLGCAVRAVASFFGAAAVENDWLTAAARWAFALDWDLDTVSSMARRVGDEIEQTREVIGLVAAAGDAGPGGGIGRELMVREVVRELRMRECGFMDQLAELEEHVVLCFLNINRARRMVLQEIVAQQHG